MKHYYWNSDLEIEEGYINVFLLKTQAVSTHLKPVQRGSAGLQHGVPCSGSKLIDAGIAAGGVLCLLEVRY